MVDCASLETSDWREEVGLPKAALKINEGRAAWERPSSKHCDISGVLTALEIIRELLARDS